MSEKMEDKITAINRMVFALGKLTEAEIRTRMAGRDDLADQVRAKHEELREEIDRLRGKVADEWTLSAKQVTEALRRASTNVQDKIRAIRNNINTAQNVVRIIQEASAAIGFVRGLV